MARYVGDLTDPKNSRERQVAINRLEGIVSDIRNLKVRNLEITYDRQVIGSHMLGISPSLSAWAVGLGVTLAPSNRHEEMEPFRDAGKHEKGIEFMP